MLVNTPKFPPWKKLLFSAMALFLVILVIELLLRALFALIVGPSVFLYGTPRHYQQIDAPAESDDGFRPRKSVKDLRASLTTEQWRDQRSVWDHANAQDGYTKYFPYQSRFDFDVDTGEKFEVSINRSGFRGADFALQKDPGVIRIINLGASSTFGYYNRDHETYPYYLQQMLNERAGSEGLRFEVVNLGIPHITADAVHRLFLAEALPLEPDIITFYEGNNDAVLISSPPYFGPRSPSQKFVRLIELAGDRSVLMGLVGSLLKNWMKVRHSVAELQQHASAIRENFLVSLTAILEACREREVLFVVATQQRSSAFVARHDQKGVTYLQEVEQVRARMALELEMEREELHFLAHAALMKGLMEWATQNQVPLVDVIAQTDHDRSVMVSQVHLSALGNRRVAKAFAHRISQLVPELEVSVNRPPLDGRRKQ